MLFAAGCLVLTIRTDKSYG